MRATSRPGRSHARTSIIACRWGFTVPGGKARHVPSAVALPDAALAIAASRVSTLARAMNPRPPGGEDVAFATLLVAMPRARHDGSASHCARTSLEHAMTSAPRHFGINADDLERARRFYERVFGWTITPSQWPDWCTVTVDGLPTGGLAKRRSLLDAPMNTFELTLAVDDVAATLATAESLGARALMEPSQVGGGGPLVAYFADLDGNLCGIGRYPEAHAPVPTLRHFAINADDVQRAKAFYEAVFDWPFAPWGPPDYYVADLGGVHAALQERRELIGGVRTNGFEPTFAVRDIRAVLAAVDANGGRSLMPPFVIEGVGDIGYFVDTEGNLCGAAAYVTTA
jgi:predicted enzyme related to lactoylglutathione lyase